MTVKEMFKKVNKYNELSEEFGDLRRITLVCNIGLRPAHIRVDSYKEFKEYVVDEYIACVAEAILKYEDYGFEKKTEVTANDSWGYKFTEEVEFWTEEV